MFMFENINSYNIVLASNSPRRKELLSGLGLEFEVKVLPDVDESYPKNLLPEEVPIYIASKKANANRVNMADNDLLITADTVVICNGKILGKPKNAAEAYEMLNFLSGKVHQVVTGVCLTTIKEQRKFSATSDVTFKNLTSEEIEYYIQNFKPYDKAGAYGIQEWIGYIGVTKINGSFFNVMGLPVQRLYSELELLKKV